MEDADRTTCPRCGAPAPSDDPAGLCPRCVLSDVQGDMGKIPLARPSAPGRVLRKLALASAVAAIAVILLGGLWFGKTREQPAGADAEALIDRGVNLTRQGKLEEAIAAYGRAIRLKPDDPAARYNFAEAFKALGKPDQATAEWRAAVRLWPDFSEAHYDLGTVLKEQGRTAEALAEFRKARDNAPRGSELARLIERALADTDR